MSAPQPTVEVPADLGSLTTPCLLLDREKLRANIRRLSAHIGSLGGVIRPHVKTNKSIDVTLEIIAAGNARGITVSTLKEAEYFFEQGIVDIFYAVGIAPNKFNQAAQLIRRGCDLKLTLDTEEMAQLLSRFGAEQGVSFKVLIELDTDGHRSGTDPSSDELLAIGHALSQGTGTELLGVMAHAGESYSCRTQEELLAMARQERDRSVAAAQRLRREGHACPVVSIGSTPTAFAIDDLAGVTEVRAGVYVFFDLVMAGVGVCTYSDIALSVLVSVIGYQKEKNWLITDGGWMALSRDRGTANQAIDYGYGRVLDAAAEPLEDLIVVTANQEHGVVSCPVTDVPLDYNCLALGTMLRVQPNHACATAAQFDRYTLVEGSVVVDEWQRISGW